MGFINQTHYQYYTPGQKFVTNTSTANGGQSGTFLLTLDPLPTGITKFLVFKNSIELDDSLYNYSATGSNAGKIIFTSGNHPVNGDIIEVELVNPIIAGNYRYISLNHIIDKKKLLMKNLQHLKLSYPKDKIDPSNPNFYHLD